MKKITQIFLEGETLTLNLTLDLKKILTNFLVYFHWNIDSILAYKKPTLQTPYSVVHEYDVICIFEMYLDSISEYHSIRADHPNDVKQVF